MVVNGYRCMWLVVMFDLPVDTKAAQKAAAGFRKSLLEDGFQMLQYSVYGRCCASRESTEMHQSRIESCLPPDGEVRILPVTDKQFERMQVFFGKRRKAVESGPRQLEFF